MLRWFLVLCALAPALSARTFEPHRDGFAFANETVFAYGVDEGRLHMQAKEEQAAYSRRCFVMTRSALQFWNFAEFQPKAARLTEAEYRHRVRQIVGTPVWSGRRMRVALPGFADLWSFSDAYRRMLQEELGKGLPTYFRVGNWRMSNPLTRLRQGLTARLTARALERGELRALYLCDFPHMNHAVVALEVDRRPDGSMLFHVYDPNYAGQAAWLRYDVTRHQFIFQKRFYYPGGVVCAIPIYRWLLD